MRTAKSSLKMWGLMAVSMAILYQNCGKLHSQAEGISFGPGINYSSVTNTFLITGVYKEYIADHKDGKNATLISAVEISNQQSFQFTKSSFKQPDLARIAVGDPVQIEIQNSASIQKAVASFKASSTEYSQIQVKPVAMRKTYEALGLFALTDEIPSGQVDLDFAIVYVDYIDHKTDETNDNLPNEVIQTITGSTWNSIRMHATRTDIFRLQKYTNYPGCDAWFSIGGDAIQHATRTSGKNYHRVVTIVPSADVGSCYWSGITSSGQSYQSPYPSPIVSRSDSSYVAAHELGHSLGLGHSSQPDQGNYGDNHDIMGRGDNFNVAKLLDLNVLKYGLGLNTVTESSQTLSISGKTTNIFTSGKVIAYQLREFLISLSENYGLTIHTRDGGAAQGNIPTSLEHASLKPGEIWQSPNGAQKIQLLRWDINANTASFKVNSATDPDYGYDGGCHVYATYGPSLYMADVFSDVDFGFLEFSTGSIGSIGNCGRETLTVRFAPENADVTVPASVDLTLDLRSISQQKILVPFSKINVPLNHKIRVQIQYKGKTVDDFTPTIQSAACTADVWMCQLKDSCKLPAQTSVMMNLDTARAGEIRTGSLVINNPNGAKCAIQEFEINLEQANSINSTSNLQENDVDLGSSLQSLIYDSRYLLRSKVYIPPGETVRVPLKIYVRNSNLNSILRFNLRNADPNPALKYIDISWSSLIYSTTNKFLLPTTYAHPHRPQELTPLNITGLISSMPPTCRLQVFDFDQFKDLSSVSVDEGGSLRLRVSSQYASSVEYSCNDGLWTNIGILNDEITIPGMASPLTCQIRAKRSDGNRVQTTNCSPISQLAIQILLADKLTCTKDTGSTLNAFSLTSSFRISDRNKGKMGYKYLLGRTKTGDWYSFNGSAWVAGQVPLSPTAAALSDISNMRVFNHDDLTPYADGEIIFGYGIGTSAATALSEMKNAQRMYPCTTLQ